jgi:microcystin-dependent protein
MSYTITTSDNSLTIVIPDGHFDNTTSLTLPGPNAVGYGQFLDQNILQLLENFASNTSPSGESVQGQLWFNKSSKTLNVFTGTQGYLPVSGIIVSTSQPVNANVGNTWYDTTRNQYFFFDGTYWNLIGPSYTRAQGISGAIPTSIDDATLVGVTHNVLELRFGNQLLATLSGDSTFVPTPSITGFPQIFRGLTLNNNLFPGNNQFYTNANTAAYLPTDPTIISLTGNIVQVETSTIATIQAANVALTNYINQESAAIQADIEIAVTTLNATANAIVANTKTYVDNLTANIQHVYNDLVANIAIIDAGLDGVTAAWTANAVTQQTQINTLIAGSTTQTYSDNSTKYATTAFVQNVLPKGVILMWGGSVATIPAGWALCNGQIVNGVTTPDLRGQFIVGAGGTYNPAATGGVTGVALSTANLPSHTHGIGGSAAGTTGSAGSHSHTATTTATDSGHSHSVSESPHTHSTTFNRTSKSNNATPYMLTDPNVGENMNGSVALATSPASTGLSIVSGHASISASTTLASVGDHQHSVSISIPSSTDATGSGASFSTLPPYYALCYIQKTF